MNKKIYCPQLPLTTDENDQYLVITDILANVKQKLKMIILTNPGEKLMDPNFGVGIKRYLFEPSSGQVNIDLTNSQSKISVNSYNSTLGQSIIRQISTYTNDIIVQDLYFSVEDFKLNLTLEYIYGSYYNDALFIVF